MSALLFVRPAPAEQYQDLIRGSQDKTQQDVDNIPCWYFCDNEFDANDCGQLALKGIKRATASSLWTLEANQEPLPKVGDLNIVTDWHGNGLCIIETTQVDIIEYRDIDETHALLEGEGDKSLNYWRSVHSAYYTRELEPLGKQFSEEMPVVFEQFKVVCKLDESKDS